MNGFRHIFAKPFCTQIDTFIHPNPDLPSSELTYVKGDIIHDSRAGLVPCIKNFPVEDINTKSKEFVVAHRGIANEGKAKLIQQNQRLRKIPVCEVKYSYKENHNERFWIYGKQNELFFEKSPIKDETRQDCMCL